jgi:ankyrin repeat protein
MNNTYYSHIFNIQSHSIEQINSYYNSYNVNEIIGANGETILYVACGESCIDKVKVLINLGGDVNIVTKYGNNLVDAAALGGKIEIVKYLIEEKNLDWSNALNSVNVKWENVVDYILGLEPNLEKVYPVTGTVLQKACLCGNVKFVERLLKAGSNPNTVNSCGVGPITSMIKDNLEVGETISIINLLVSYGLNVEQKYNNGRTNLMDACHAKRVDIVNLLISIGCDVNCAEPLYKQTALMMACQKDSVEIVKLLIKAKADIYLKTIDGGRAIDFTNNEEIKNLVKVDDDWFNVNIVVPIKDRHLININKPIRIKTVGGNPDPNIKIKPFVNNFVNPDPNIKLYEDCLKNPSYDIRRAPFVNNSVNPDLNVKPFDDCLKNPSHDIRCNAACLDTNIKSRTFFRQIINHADNQGKTALMIACEKNHVSIIATLINAGADISIISKEGKTAIDYTTNEEIRKLITQKM